MITTAKYTLINAALMVIFSISALAQKNYTTQKDVFEATEITFYGYDFSHFKLAETKRMLDENIKTLVPGVIGFLNEHTTENDLQKRFKKERVKFSFDHMQTVVKNIKNEDIVSMVKHNIHADSIQSIINSYNINEKEGIGFVVIVECFEKITKRSTAYFVFFDIASKKIIMSDYFGGKEADGYGLINYWGVGMNATFGKYIADVYRKRAKQFKS